MKPQSKELPQVVQLTLTREEAVLLTGLVLIAHSAVHTSPVPGMIAEGDLDTLLAIRHTYRRRPEFVTGFLARFQKLITSAWKE